VVRGSDKAEEARKLIEYFLQPAEQRVFVQNNHEYPVRGGPSFNRDSIDVEGAGSHLREAVRLMNEVGWD
jgi:ABC-type Fe3+ transport system substrate-binding protein